MHAPLRALLKYANLGLFISLLIKVFQLKVNISAVAMQAKAPDLYSFTQGLQVQIPPRPKFFFVLFSPIKYQKTYFAYITKHYSPF